MNSLSNNTSLNISKEESNTMVHLDNHAVSKRLKKELMSLMVSTDKSVSAFPESDNIFKWIGTIQGPKDTVYEGLKFRLQMEFSSSYPYNAPNIKFTTPLFHPNVDTSGAICLDILKENWSPSYDVRTILLSIQSLLGEPNNNSPLNCEAADLWSNKTLFRAQVLEMYNKSQS